MKLSKATGRSGGISTKTAARITKLPLQGFRRVLPKIVLICQTEHDNNTLDPYVCVLIEGTRPCLNLR